MKNNFKRLSCGFNAISKNNLELLEARRVFFALGSNPEGQETIDNSEKTTVQVEGDVDKDEVIRDKVLNTVSEAFGEEVDPYFPIKSAEFDKENNVLTMGMEVSNDVIINIKVDAQTKTILEVSSDVKLSKSGMAQLDILHGQNLAAITEDVFTNIANEHEKTVEDKLEADIDTVIGLSELKTAIDQFKNGEARALQNFVGTTYTLDKSALNIQFTIKEIVEGQPIIELAFNDKSYEVSALDIENNAVTVSTKNGNELTLQSRGEKVDIGYKGEFNSSKLEGRFSVNDEGKVEFTGKVNGEKLSGDVNPLTGEIKQNLLNKVFNGSEAVEGFQGMFGAIQQVLSEILAMAEESGILSMFGLKLGEYPNSDAQMTLFSLRNKLNLDNGKHFLEVSANSALDALNEDGTKEQLAVLSSLGFNTEKAQGSALLITLKRINQLRESDSAYNVQDSESLSEYLNRTGLIDVNGLWSTPVSMQEVTTQPPEVEETLDDPFSLVKKSLETNLQTHDHKAYTKLTEKMLGDGYQFNDNQLKIEEANKDIFSRLLNIKCSEIKEQSDIQKILTEDGYAQMERFVQLAYTGLTSTEVQNFNINNAYGLESIAKERNIKLEDITFGDLLITVLNFGYESDNAEKPDEEVVADIDQNNNNADQQPAANAVTVDETEKVQAEQKDDNEQKAVHEVTNQTGGPDA